MFEQLTSVRDSLESAARGFDPDACSGSEAVRLVEVLGSIRRLTDGMIAKAARRVAETGAHASRGDRSAAELSARTVGVGTGEARRAIETATRLEKLPVTDAAVRSGELSGAAAQLIADAAVCNPDAEAALVAIAAQGLVPLRESCITARAAVEDPAARARRQHGSRSCRMWSGSDGMLEGRFRLTPEVGGAFKARIDADTRAMFRARSRAGECEAHDAYAADALVDAVLEDPAETESTAGAAGRQPTGYTAGARPTEYTAYVVIDHAALVRGQARPGERCDIPGVGPVDVAWVRELLGSAFVTAIVKKGRDITTVAHFGRHIPAELRTAMVVGGRECSVEGCTARDYLELDHCVTDWAKGGPTARWNLAWLCSVHHRRKTRGWLLGPPHPTTGKRTLVNPADRRAA